MREPFAARRGFSKQQRCISEELAAARTAAGVLEVAARRLPQLDAVNAVTALHRLAGVPGGRSAMSGPMFGVLVHWALQSRDSRGVANSLWSLATLPCGNLPLLDALAASSLRLIAEIGT